MYQNKIIELSLLLNTEGFQKESAEVSSLLEKISFQEISEDQTLEELFGIKPKEKEKPAVDPDKNEKRIAELEKLNEAWSGVLENHILKTPQRASFLKYLGIVSNHLDDAAPLVSASAEEIETLLNSNALKIVTKSMNSPDNFDKIIKLSSERDLKIFICEKLSAEGKILRPDYKKAGFWSGLWSGLGTASKYLFPLASVLFAIGAWYRMFKEMEKLQVHLPKLGLTLMDSIFRPYKFKRLAESSKDDPEKTSLVADATNLSMYFVDEITSAIADSIDALKDIIFLIFNIASGGLTLVIDLGISAIIWFVHEWAADPALLGKFKDVILDMQYTVNKKVLSLSRKIMEFEMENLLA